MGIVNGLDLMLFFLRIRKDNQTNITAATKKSSNRMRTIYPGRISVNGHFGYKGIKTKRKPAASSRIFFSSQEKSFFVDIIGAALAL